MRNNKNTITGPGRLEGQIVIRLDTFDAVLALRGRPVSDKKNKKQHISGLYDFSARLSTIYSAAEFGDPFAIYALVLIEEQFTDTGKAFTEFEKGVAKIKKSHASGKMTIIVPKSVKPSEFKLTLAHYGATAARMILRYDDLILEVKNLVHLNLLPSAAGREWIQSMAKLMRSLLSAGMRYRFTSIKKEDLKQNNQLANMAIQKLLESGFLDMRQFKSIEELQEFFIIYPFKPEFGPDVVVDDQTFVDRSKRPGADSGSKYDMFVPRKASTDKSSRRDNSSKGPFKGKEDSVLKQKKSEKADSVADSKGGRGLATKKKKPKVAKKKIIKRKKGETV